MAGGPQRSWFRSCATESYEQCPHRDPRKREYSIKTHFISAKDFSNSKQKHCAYLIVNPRFGTLTGRFNATRLPESFSSVGRSTHA
jgi:hypothetical protein